MKLQPNETDLLGHWTFEGGSMRSDVTCERIRWLTLHALEKIAVSPEHGAWETLYRDPNDSRFWELTYPQGHMHGGGPPRLHVLSPSEALLKYRLAGASE